jgi:arylsulfatase A-like enzyme
VIFTGGTKIAEHGGFNEDDIHIALLVSLPSLPQKTVESAVLNQQVAPTIIKALGFDPNQLQAVQQEQINVLPFLFNALGIK